MKEPKPAALPAAEILAVPDGAVPAPAAQVGQLAQAQAAARAEPLVANRVGPQPIMRIKASESGLDFVVQVKGLTPAFQLIKKAGVFKGHDS